MGFGLLFIGYFLTFLTSLSPFGYVFSLVGMYVILCAIQKLSEYKHIMSRCLVPLCTMALCTVYEATYDINQRFFKASGFIFSDTVLTAEKVIFLIASLSFHLFLLLAIAELGKDTRIENIVYSAKGNIFPISAYSVLYLAQILLAQAQINSPIVMLITLALLILMILYPVLNLALFYSCFSKICSSNEPEPTEVPSKFKFVNEMRERQKEKQIEAEKLRAEMQRKLEEKSNKKRK